MVTDYSLVDWEYITVPKMLAALSFPFREEIPDANCNSCRTLAQLFWPVHRHMLYIWVMP